MGDTRTDPGQYYPGGRVVSRRDVAPPQIVVQWSDVQGKPQIEQLPERYRERDVKDKINEIASKFATVAVAALIGWTACADVSVQKKRKDEIYNDDLVVVDVTDSGIDTNTVEKIANRVAEDEVSKADHMPTKWYTVRGGVTQEVVKIRAIVSGTGKSKRTVLMYFEPQTDDDVLSMQMKDRTLVTFQSGSGVSVKDGAKITLGKPDRLLVNGSTNLEQYVQAAKPADYETVKAKANGAAPQSTTYTKTETDELIAANKPEYEDVPSNVVWRIEAEGGRFFFKPVRPIHTED